MICFLAIILNLISLYFLLPTAGITMAASTRKLPNCFNFLRQLEILGRAGHDGSAGAFTAHALILLFELVQSESYLHSCFGVKDFPSARSFNQHRSKEWDNHTRIAKAFQIGSREAAAVSNLQERVCPAVVKCLREDVRPRGMKLWLSHEIIAKNIFNLGFSSGTGTYQPWQDALTNAADNELVALTRH